MTPHVVQAVANRDFSVTVWFADGQIRRFSVRPVIERQGVWARLADLDRFQREVTVLNGTVAWSADFDPRRCLDLDPWTLYSSGEPVKEASEVVER
jgi:hypothetical protein